MKQHKISFHIFLILVFVLAQVSPACAFSSGGRSSIEICAADGSKKIVSVSNEFSPVKPKQEKTTQKDCAFCLHQGLGVLVPEGASITPPVLLAQSVMRAGSSAPVCPVSSHTQARAPPPLIS